MQKEEHLELPKLLKLRNLLFLLILQLCLFLVITGIAIGTGLVSEQEDRNRLIVMGRENLDDTLDSVVTEVGLSINQTRDVTHSILNNWYNSNLYTNLWPPNNNTTPWTWLNNRRPTLFTTLSFRLAESMTMMALDGSFIRYLKSDYHDSDGYSNYTGVLTEWRPGPAGNKIYLADTDVAGQPTNVPVASHQIATALPLPPVDLTQARGVIRTIVVEGLTPPYLPVLMAYAPMYYRDDPHRVPNERYGTAMTTLSLSELNKQIGVIAFRRGRDSRVFILDLEGFLVATSHGNVSRTEDVFNAVRRRECLMSDDTVVRSVCEAIVLRNRTFSCEDWDNCRGSVDVSGKWVVTDVSTAHGVQYFATASFVFDARPDWVVVATVSEDALLRDTNSSGLFSVTIIGSLCGVALCVGYFISGCVSIMARQHSNAVQRVHKVAQQLVAKNNDLYQARRDAEVSNEAKRTFMSYIFHEVRVPMNAVMLGVDVLLGSANEMTDDCVSVACTIKEQVLITRKILDDVLSMQKIEQGRFTIDLASFDVYDLICQIETLFQTPGNKRTTNSGGGVPGSSPPPTLQRRHTLTGNGNGNGRATPLSHPGGGGASASAHAVTNGKAGDYSPPQPSTSAYSSSSASSDTLSHSDSETETTSSASSASTESSFDGGVRYTVSTSAASLHHTQLPYTATGTGGSTGVGGHGMGSAFPPIDEKGDAEPTDVNFIVGDPGMVMEHAHDSFAGGGGALPDSTPLLGGLDDVAFIIKADPRLPRYFLGDRHRLQQVICNLISNAMKFTLRGSVTFEVTLAGETDTETQIRMAVRDTGVGISEVDQERLFQPYVQIRAGALQKGGGTGLGLSICQHIVSLHHGKIGVTSVHGQGSEFFFTLTSPKNIDPPEDESDAHSPGDITTRTHSLNISPATTILPGLRGAYQSPPRPTAGDGVSAGAPKSDAHSKSLLSIGGGLVTPPTASPEVAGLRTLSQGDMHPENRKSMSSNGSDGSNPSGARLSEIFSDFIVTIDPNTPGPPPSEAAPMGAASAPSVVVAAPSSSAPSGSPAGSTRRLSPRTSTAGASAPFLARLTSLPTPTGPVSSPTSLEEYLPYRVLAFSAHRSPEISPIQHLAVLAEKQRAAQASGSPSHDASRAPLSTPGNSSSPQPSPVHQPSGATTSHGISTAPTSAASTPLGGVVSPAATASPGSSAASPASSTSHSASLGPPAELARVPSAQSQPTSAKEPGSPRSRQSSMTSVSTLQRHSSLSSNASNHSSYGLSVKSSTPPPTEDFADFKRTVGGSQSSNVLLASAAPAGTSLPPGHPRFRPTPLSFPSRQQRPATGSTANSGKRGSGSSNASNTPTVKAVQSVVHHPMPSPPSAPNHAPEELELGIAFDDTVGSFAQHVGRLDTATQSPHSQPTPAEPSPAIGSAGGSAAEPESHNIVHASPRPARPLSISIRSVEASVMVSNNTPTKPSLEINPHNISPPSAKAGLTPTAILQASQPSPMSQMSPAAVQPSPLATPNKFPHIPRTPPAPSLSTAPTPTKLNGPRRPRALVVEDSLPNMRLMERVLVQLGWDCNVLANGKLAVDFVEGYGGGDTDRKGPVAFASDFDIVLMDRNMPVMSGDDATRKLRFLSVPTPIIGLTGCALEDERATFFEAGITDMLSKPVTRQDLLNTFTKHCPDAAKRAQKPKPKSPRVHMPVNNGPS